MPDPTIEDLAIRVTALERQLAQLMASRPQGQPTRRGGATFESLLGAGKDLWASEDEFDEFMKLLAERRRQG